MNGNQGAPQSDGEEKKSKKITLANLKRVSVLQQLSISKGSGQPGFLSAPGEDSDIPYISDNSAFDA